MSRESLEEYASRLESVVYGFHELFWFCIDENARVVPIAHIEDEDRLTGLAICGRDEIVSHRGQKADRIRVKKMLIDRMSTLARFTMSAIVVVIVVEETLSCFGYSVFNGW